MKASLSRMAICAMLVLAGTALDAQAAAFTNGGFESPMLDTNGGRYYHRGDSGLDGWTIGGSDGLMLLVNDTTGYGIGGPLEGRQFLIFDTGDWPNGMTISQTFDTRPGHRYVLRFNVGKLGASPDPMQATAAVTASDGAVLGIITASSPPAWAWGPTRTLRFTATTSLSTLTFEDTSVNTTNGDLVLDNVSVELQRPLATIAVSSVDVCWSSFTNTLYQVQYQSDSTTNLWTDLGAPVPGNGSTVCITDSARGDARRNYRVRELP
jgi:hypothetical protein